MERILKRRIINIIILIILIIAVYFAFFYNPAPPEVELAKCIGKNSILYVQQGCPHCERQKDLFGENLQEITVVDCSVAPQDCLGITHTPTWKIKQENYIGVHSIEELKNLTQC